MTANIIYKDYDKRVQEYMQNVIECLEQDYGKIPSSWRVSLDLIADNYSIYLQAKDEIMNDKMFSTDNYGRKFKHPAYGIMNQAQTQLKDLLKSFSLTPMSRARMNSLRKDDMEDMDADKYLDELVG